MIVKSLLFFTLLFLFTACEKQEKTASSMKCGAGKCGANMFDTGSTLAKKKSNIIKQMRKDDPRKDCVLQAKSSKSVYNCVREPNGKKLTTKCGVQKSEPAMKCGTNRCGSM